MNASVARTSVLFVLLGLLPCASALLAADASPAPLTAILTAMGSEFRPLEKQLSKEKVEEVLGVAFHRGTLHGRSIVLAQTGVGKVNAAWVTALVIERFHPTEVVFSGIAGGINPDLSHGDVIFSRQIVQHDLGTLTDDKFTPEPFNAPFRMEKPPLFLTAGPSLLAAAKSAARRVELEKIPLSSGARVPRIVEGVIASGDTFVASAAKSRELRKRYGADAVEMEGAAVAQVCWQQKVPFLVIRSVSDSANRMAGEDLMKFLHIAARNATSLAVAVVEELSITTGK